MSCTLQATLEALDKKLSEAQAGIVKSVRTWCINNWTCDCIGHNDTTK